MPTAGRRQHRRRERVPRGAQYSLIELRGRIRIGRAQPLTGTDKNRQILIKLIRSSFLKITYIFDFEYHHSDQNLLCCFFGLFLLNKLYCLVLISHKNPLRSANSCALAAAHHSASFARLLRSPSATASEPKTAPHTHFTKLLPCAASVHCCNRGPARLQVML